MEPTARTMRRAARVLTIAAGLCAAAALPVSAADRARGKLIVQWDHLDDSNGRELEDFWAFLSYRQVHAQVWSGEFTDGFQVGGYVADRRGSTYALLYRYRHDADHIVQLTLEQVLDHGFVGAASIRGIRVIPDTPDDRHQVQFRFGFDKYWGDYNFLTFRAANDPRDSERWSFLAGHRFQPGPDFYVQPSVILRTDDSTGWMVGARYRVLRLTVGEFDRFDYTSFDRRIASVGVEIPY